MVFPSFSGRLASSIAAKAAAPEEITDKNPFTLADELSGCKCIFVGNGDNLIVDFRVQHIGDKACADALNLMRSCNAGREHCGSSRLNSNDLNRRVLGFQIFTDTGYRTAGTHTCNKDIDFSVSSTFANLYKVSPEHFSMCRLMTLLRAIWPRTILPSFCRSTSHPY